MLREVEGDAALVDRLSWADSPASWPRLAADVQHAESAQAELEVLRARLRHRRKDLSRERCIRAV